MKKNRSLWIVLGAAGGLLVLCILGVVVVGALGFFGENAPTVYIDLGIPTAVPLAEQIVLASETPAPATATRARNTATEKAIDEAPEPTETDEPEAIPTPEAETPTEEPAPIANTGDQNGATVGKQVKTGSTALTVVSVTNVPDFSGWTPAEGSIYLDFEVELENTGSETLSYSPVNFKAEDTSGKPYDHSFQSVQPSITSGQLAPGESVRGHLTFEVPGKPGDSFTLVYRPQNAADEDAIHVTVEAPVN